MITKLFQTLPKYIKELKLLIIISTFLIIYKELTKHDYIISNFGYVKEKISLLNTLRIYNQNQQNIKNVNMLSWSLLNFKVWIFEVLSSNNIANKVTKTLLFNEKQLPKYQLTLFKKIGIYHLIVISGMHIVILMNTIQTALKKINLNKAKHNIILIVVCTFYLLIIKLTFPVLYQVLKLTLKDVNLNKNLKFTICAILMCLINYDNFNVLSYFLTIGIQMIILNFESFDLALINISLFTNLILYKYNMYFNLLTLLFTPVLILFFEKIFFQLVLLNLVCCHFFNFLLTNMYINFIHVCMYLNVHFNILIQDWKVIWFFIITIILINCIYLRSYENK